MLARKSPDVGRQEILVIKSSITQGADLGDDFLTDSLKPACWAWVQTPPA